MKKTTLCHIEKDNCYLMLYRNKKKNDENGGKWVGVGGKFEPGETAEQCLVREVFEETGLTLTGYIFHGIVRFESDIWGSEDMYIYTGTEFSGDLREDCEEGELSWIPKSEVMSLPMWAGDRIFLKKILNNETNIRMTLRYKGESLEEVLDEIQ